MSEKFQRLDQRYFDARKELSKRVGARELWSLIDQWPLYCGIANLGRYLAISDILRQTLDVPGDVVEFGSWRGANLMLLAKLLRIFDPHGCKRVHCFDSFKGLTEFAPEDGQATQFTGLYKGALDELKAVIELYELQDEIEIHQGVIESSLRPFVEAQKEASFSFIYCDTDLYKSTKLILELLHPRLSKHGVFVFDEWNYKDYPGETVAAKEFLETYGDKYEVMHVRHARQPTMYLRKLSY